MSVNKVIDLLLLVPPEEASKYYLRGDGVWVKIESPPVAHEELHRDNGNYDE